MGENCPVIGHILGCQKLVGPLNLKWETCYRQKAQELHQLSQNSNFVRHHPEFPGFITPLPLPVAKSFEPLGSDLRCAFGDGAISQIGNVVTVLAYIVGQSLQTNLAWCLVLVQLLPKLKFAEPNLDRLIHSPLLRFSDDVQRLVMAPSELLNQLADLTCCQVQLIYPKALLLKYTIELVVKINLEVYVDSIQLKETESDLAAH